MQEVPFSMQLPQPGRPSSHFALWVRQLSQACAALCTFFFPIVALAPAATAVEEYGID
jgi:hypothetical protein